MKSRTKTISETNCKKQLSLQILKSLQEGKREFSKAEIDCLVEFVSNYVQVNELPNENQMRLRNEHLLSVLLALKNINKLITNEKDKARLVQEVAEILVLNRGYHGAWIVLNNGSPQNSITASAGLGFDFMLLEEKIKKGEQVHCIENCYKTEGVVIIDNPAKDCEKCPLAHKYENRSALAIRLTYGTRILGVLSVSIPAALAHDDEEIQLFTEIAADISLAIYNLDLESDKARQQKEIAEKENVFRSVLQTTSDGFWMLNAKGKIIEVNAAFCAMTGYSRYEIIGMSVNDIDFAESVNETQARIERIIKNGSEIFETELHRKDGTVFPVEVSATFITEKGGIFVCFGRDLTLRKQNEYALKQSEERFRTLIETASDSIFLISEDGLILDANKCGLQLLGYQKDELLNQAIDVIDPNFSTEQFIEFWEKVPFNETRIFETTHRKKGGGFIPVEVSGQKYQISGKTYYYGIARDITERKLAEQKILENKANLKAIVNNSLDSIWLVNNNYEIQFLNEVFVQQFQLNFGVKLEKGVNIIQAIPEPLRKFWKERYDRVLKNEHLIFEDIVKTNTGNVFIEVSMQPVVVDGTVTGASVYGRDITGTRKAEKEIQNAADRFRGLIENAPDGVAIINADGKFLYASPNAKRHFGYLSNEEANMNGMDLVHPDDIPIVLEVLQKIYAHPDEKATAVYRFKHYSGAYHWIETTFSNMLAHEAIQGIVMNFTDITERKKLFEEMQAAKDIAEKSEKEIQVKNEELLAAKEKAEESDRLKSAFLANMSHEIRTPMNGILGFTNLLGEENLTEEERQNYIRIIQKSGDRLLETVNDLIDVSKIETGQMNVVNSLTDINETLNYLYQFFIPQAAEKNIELRLNVKLNEGKTKIFTDQVKLNSVLTNLIKNAIKFTHSGFIEIGCHLHESALEKKSDGQNEMILFYVRDTGIGIAKEHHESVFNRFIQAELGEARTYQGAGLGLTIAKACTEMLGGKIWLESEIGKGTVFYFNLPACYAEVPVSHEPTAETLGDKGKPHDKLKIMIAEDDDDGFFYLETILKHMNPKILHCDNGLSAVEMCKSNPDIDIILMDIRMPVMNGFDATRKIREFNTHVVIIAQTAFALAGDKENAIDAGCTDYIAKPIKREELLTLINRYIEGIQLNSTV